MFHLPTSSGKHRARWFRPRVPTSGKPGRHRAPEVVLPRSRDGALVAGSVAAVVAAILLLSGVASVASPDVAPVALESAVCQ